jgi:hypothetical protein
VIHPAVLVVKPLKGTFGEDHQLGGIKHVTHVKATLDLGNQIVQIFLDILATGTSIGLGLDRESQIGFNQAKYLLFGETLRSSRNAIASLTSC